MARPRFELWGESVREIGLLVLVFVPLDMLISPGTAPNWKNIQIFGVVGLILIVLGVEIERS